MEEEKVQEGVETQAVQKWDWKDVTGFLIVDTGMEQKSKQASITDWTQDGKEREQETTTPTE